MRWTGLDILAGRCVGLYCLLDETGKREIDAMLAAMTAAARAS